MRVLLLCGWLLLLPAALAYHLGAGQTQKALDATATELAAAEKLSKAEDYDAAVERFDLALKSLPQDRQGESKRIRVERAKALMLAKKLPDAHSDMNALVDELQADPKADPKLLADARAVQANSQYYMTWLMRLEGQGREVWEPEIEAARQTYKLLAEQTADATEKKKHAEDLEAAVRLARMDLSELQGLPLPSQ